jgi:hypothetical protein
MAKKLTIIAYAALLSSGRAFHKHNIKGSRIALPNMKIMSAISHTTMYDILVASKDDAFKNTVNRRDNLISIIDGYDIGAFNIKVNGGSLCIICYQIYGDMYSVIAYDMDPDDSEIIDIKWQILMNRLCSIYTILIGRSDAIAVDFRKYICPDSTFKCKSIDKFSEIDREYIRCITDIANKFGDGSSSRIRIDLSNKKIKLESLHTLMSTTLLRCNSNIEEISPPSSPRNLHNLLRETSHQIVSSAYEGARSPRKKERCGPIKKARRGLIRAMDNGLGAITRMRKRITN